MKKHVITKIIIYIKSFAYLGHWLFFCSCILSPARQTVFQDPTGIPFRHPCWLLPPYPLKTEEAVGWNWIKMQWVENCFTYWSFPEKRTKSVTVTQWFRLPLGTEQVVSSIPGSVGYISHVHWAYDYLGPFGVLRVHMAWHKNCVKKSWVPQKPNIKTP